MYTRLLLLLVPILLIQVGIAAVALVDLSKRKAVRGPRRLWAVILVVTAFAVPTGIIASGIYLAWARQVEVADDLD